MSQVCDKCLSVSDFDAVRTGVDNLHAGFSKHRATLCVGLVSRSRALLLLLCSLFSAFLSEELARIVDATLLVFMLVSV